MSLKSSLKENLSEDSLISAQASLRESLREQKIKISSLRAQLSAAEHNFDCGVALSEEIARALPHTVEILSDQKTPTTRAKSMSPEQAQEVIKKVLAGSEKLSPDEILSVGTMLVHQIRRQKKIEKRQEEIRSSNARKVLDAKAKRETNEHGLKFARK